MFNNSHILSLEEIEQQSNSDFDMGLSDESIQANSEKFGSNILTEKRKVSLFIKFLQQLNNPLVILLIVTSVFALFIGDVVESILITTIVFFMALIGLYIENKSDQALSKLKSLVKVNVQVLRAGSKKTMSAEKLVVGDIIYLYEGDKIPADARIIKSQNLSINEMVLTGESLPVKKSFEYIGHKEDLIPSQLNMVFSGTNVSSGSAKCVVVKVGDTTEIGKVAMQLNDSSDNTQTPLQKELEKLSKLILYLTLVICIAVAGLTVIRAESINYEVIIESLVLGLSLAIAFIPEGLSAVMTVTLALGVKEMVKYKVILKRLLAAESLGSVSIIATDKTGTITTGKMAVDKIWFMNREVEPRKVVGTTQAEKNLIDVVAYCNNSKGATEEALMNFLQDKGFRTGEVQARVAEHQFVSDLKRMTVLYKKEGAMNAFSKGAPEILVNLCTHYQDYDTDIINSLTEVEKQQILKKVDDFARDGFRVLGLAVKKVEDVDETQRDRNKDEANLVFVGLVALMDPLRPEVKDTVQSFLTAGIRPIMITGDHHEIAKTIARNAGIDDSDNVITGVEIEEYFAKFAELTESQKLKFLNCRVFARVTPDHKTKLIKLFQDSGYVIAMAGDGVNDAVAISKADVGIAVAGGSEIVKEVADVVITGGYDALSKAVEVGRLVLYRTRLFLHYILSGNVSEVGVFIFALAFNYRLLPLSAISLLIINVLTDAAPAMALSVEKGDKNIMRHPPRSASESIITKQIKQSIVIQGLLSSIFLFIVFVLTYDKGIFYAQTATFTAYIFQKLFRAFTARSFEESVVSYGIFSNKFMNVAVLISLSVWFVVVFITPEIFSMQPLAMVDLLVIAGFALIFPFIEEVLKAYRRRVINSRINLNM
jgi:P-type Ca2+ transporter type 2C